MQRSSVARATQNLILSSIAELEEKVSNFEKQIQQLVLAFEQMNRELEYLQARVRGLRNGAK